MASRVNKKDNGTSNTQITIFSLQFSAACTCDSENSVIVLNAITPLVFHDLNNVSVGRDTGKGNIYLHYIQ